MAYTAAVITVSDLGSKGLRQDTSGPAVRAMLEDAGPQPDHQPARLGKSRAGEPVRRHRCSGARHAHDRRRKSRITHPVRPQQVRTFPSFSPILRKIPLRFPPEGYFYCFCGSPYFLMTATAQGILPRHRV